MTPSSDQTSFHVVSLFFQRCRKFFQFFLISVLNNLSYPIYIYLLLTVYSLASIFSPTNPSQLVIMLTTFNSNYYFCSNPKFIYENYIIDFILPSLIITQQKYSGRELQRYSSNFKIPNCKNFQTLFMLGVLTQDNDTTDD